MKSSFFTLFVFSVVIILSACSSDEKQADSPEALQTLDFETVAVIADDEDLMLSQINNVLIDSNGDILFVDSQQNMIHHFSETGEKLQSFGGSGRGPGEFQRVISIEIIEGNRLIATDGMNQNMTEFKHNGDTWEFHDSFEITGIERAFGVFIRDLKNGTFLTMNPFFFGMEMPPMDQVFQRDMMYMLVGYDGAVVDEEFLKQKGNSTLMSQSGGGFQIAMIPFTEMDIIEVSPTGELYTANNMELNVTRMDTDKNVLQTFSLPVPQSEVKPEDTEQLLSNYEGDFRRSISTAIPEMKPVVRQLKISDDGRLWVRIHTTEDQPDWIVFNPNGSPVGALRFPENTGVQQIRGNRVYAVTTTELDLPSIAIHEVDLPAL